MSVLGGFLALALAVLTACSERAALQAHLENEQVPTHAREVVYLCLDGQRFSAVFAENRQSATLHIQHRIVRLARVPSTSGDLFSDQGVYFGRDGDEAFVAEGEVVILQDCRAEETPATDVSTR